MIVPSTETMKNSIPNEIDREIPNIDMFINPNLPFHITKSKCQEVRSQNKKANPRSQCTRF